MQFNITIRSGNRDYHFAVMQIYIDNISERYQVIARNKTITFESNRPLFRSKKLKHRKPT
jgi:hypothetical protein